MKIKKVNELIKESMEIDEQEIKDIFGPILSKRIRNIITKNGNVHVSIMGPITIKYNTIKSLYDDFRSFGYELIEINPGMASQIEFVLEIIN